MIFLGWHTFLHFENYLFSVSYLIFPSFAVTAIWFWSEAVWIIWKEKNFTLSIEVVMFPQWPDLVLASNIPYGEFEIFVLNCFHIKTW